MISKKTKNMSRKSFMDGNQAKTLIVKPIIQKISRRNTQKAEKFYGGKRQTVRKLECFAQTEDKSIITLTYAIIYTYISIWAFVVFDP